MLGNYQVATQLVASRVVVSSMELVNHILNLFEAKQFLQSTQSSATYSQACREFLRTSSKAIRVARDVRIFTCRIKTGKPAGERRISVKCCRISVSRLQ
jgi:hypothetical protein